MKLKEIILAINKKNTKNIFVNAIYLCIWFLGSIIYSRNIRYSVYIKSPVWGFDYSFCLMELF